MYFTNVMETYLEVCKVSSKLSHHTLSAYEKDLDIFLDIFGKQIEIEQVTRKHLEYFVLTLSREGHKQTSIKRRLASLRAFFKWLDPTHHALLRYFKSRKFGFTLISWSDKWDYPLYTAVANSNLTSALTPICQTILSVFSPGKGLKVSG